MTQNTFNLMTSPWIPIRRQRGELEWIRPAQILEGSKKNPVLEIIASRPDFQGALMQFLIGLLQTIAAPDSAETWVERFLNPPSLDELEQACKELEGYFALEDEKHPFMQDAALSQEKIAATSIDKLLIEAPGENTTKNNTDHFIKRGHVKRLCPACAATALFALQTNAPSGGSGHRTSLRGGGPLTVLLQSQSPECQSLWHQLWLNVLPVTELKKTNCNTKIKLNKKNKKNIGAFFPWMDEIQTSDKSGGAVYGEDIHASQIYWALPRRILLNSDTTEEGNCSICARQHKYCYTSYKTRPYGINYSGIVHPLSPYYLDKKQELLPEHPQPGGFSYRHWPVYVAAPPSTERTQERSLNVRFFEQKALPKIAEKVTLKANIHVFGYDMDNMKARAWYETTMPYKNLPDATTRGLSFRMVGAAEQIIKNTKSAIKEAWLSHTASAQANLDYIEHEFWQASENDYYQAIDDLSKHTESEKRNSLLENWHSLLCRESLRLYDFYAEEVPLSDGKAKDGGIPRRIAARKKLLHLNYGKKIREGILHLPAKEKQPRKGEER